VVVRAKILPMARPQLVVGFSISRVARYTEPVLGALVSDREMVILSRVPGVVVIGLHLNPHASVAAVAGQLMQTLQSQPETGFQTNFAET